jgi:tRNA-2-methylthio-N6-dimethylallyladenosine synthase
MRRSYRRDKYMGIIERVRAAMPEASITTDIIVGFPGETEEDFMQTMDIVEQARFMNAYTFQYSKRPGTPAATMPDQVPAEVVQERYERLIALGNDIAWQENKTFFGKTVEVLVATGEGRKDEATGRVSGRAEDYRLVHVTKTDVQGVAHNVRPGDVVTARITHAAPHHLIADELLSVRPTGAGDNYEAGQRPITEGQVTPKSSGLITLGPVS